MPKCLDDTMPKENGPLDNLLLADARLGLKIYSFTQNNKIAKAVSEIFSLTGDEIVFFGLSAIGGTLVFASRGFGGLREMGCIEETLWDMFGTCSVCVTSESLLKLVFKRMRPDYASQSNFYTMHGEWFSFPSGHALRAFYVLFWLSRSRFVRLLAPIIAFPRARYIIPWAVGVGISRVAKGRHYPCDVVAGALVGALIGYIVEDQMNPFSRAILKMVSGVFVTINWGLYCVLRIFNGNDHPKVNWTGALATTVYFMYACVLLFATLPSNMEAVGSQTVTTDANNLPTCNALW